jgi:hemerythrin
MVNKMPLIKWDKSLSVNVAEIDKQHQKLIDLINQLHELMKTGEGKDAIGPVLSDLINYAATHFRTEETFFDRFNYEFTIQHKIEHKKFVEKVLAFQDKYDKGNTTLTIEVMNFLKDWLIVHIKGTDMKYTKCFNEHGLF